MISTEIHTLLLFVPCFLLSCSIIFNMAGIYYLRSLKNDFTNHKILLLNLSLVEILSSVAMIVYWFDGYFLFCNFRVVSAPNSMSTACTFGFAIDWYFYLLCLLSPLTLLPDRFLAVTFPYRCRDIFPKWKAKMALAAQWLIIALLLTMLVFISHKHWLKYLQCTAIAIELTVFGSAMMIYIWIVYKIRKQGSLFDSSSFDSRVLKIASLIILTFLCFVVIPEVTLFTMSQLHFEMADTYQRIFYTVTCINYVCDPLIYIFGYPPVHQIIRRLLRKSKRSPDLFRNTQDLQPV